MTTADLYFKWENVSRDMKSAVSIGEELIMSQFAVDDFTVQEISASYVTGTSRLFLRVSFLFSLRQSGIGNYKTENKHGTRCIMGRKHPMILRGLSAD